MKIFGIGLSKTGTTSLASALDILGYRTRDYPGLQTYVPGDLSSIDPLVLEQNEALTDTPIPSFYRELDQRYPGAKFILTVRDMDGWLLSCRKQFTTNQAEKQNEAHNRLFMDLYGTAVFNEELFRSGYQRFVAGVVAHFRERPQDLLVLDVAAGQGWNELCAFLGRPVPAMPFPKSNVTRIQWMDLNELVSVAREAAQELLVAHRSLVKTGGEGPASSLIPSLLRKTVYSLAGGRPFALESATAAAHKLLVRRLARINGEIPIVSRQSAAVPPPERARWNHFWLVDPLDGEAGFGTADGEFTVNIALIEDHKPIAGVVHAPLSDTTCYAMVGKGAFKRVGDGPPTTLRATDPDRTARSALDDPSLPSQALTLCRLIESGDGATRELVETMEWHTAAPHAVARLIGRHMIAGDGTTDLAYNKVDWRNPRVRIA